MIDEIILKDLKRIEGDLEKGLFEGKRVLVTGGAGFIGSWLVDVLANLNADVACLDNLSTGKLEYINHLLSNPRFEFIKDDVCTFESDAKYDLILHLASYASPEDYQQRPVETLRTISLGSYNMLELARKCDATILLASTSEVYGDAELVPTPEAYWGKVNPIGPRSCYYEGKRFAEALFMAYLRKYGVDVRIARIFNSYGPRLRPDGTYARVISRFIAQALTDQPLTVYGDGAQTRSFCYVTDTITSLMLLADNPTVKGEVVNVGNVEEITILDVAKKILELTGSKSSLTFQVFPEDDPKRRCPDIGKIKKILGWKPEITFKQGLKRTIAWFRRKDMKKRLAAS